MAKSKKTTTKKPEATKATDKAVPATGSGEMTTDQAQAIVDGTSSGDIVKAREVLKSANG